MHIIFHQKKKPEGESGFGPLEEWGHEILFVQEPLAALRALKENSPCLLLLGDDALPSESLKILRGLEELRENGTSAYATLLTSPEQKLDLEAAYEAGLDDYLSATPGEGELRLRLHAASRILDLRSDHAESRRILEKANRRIRAELEAAARIQASLLPQNPRTYSELDFAWRFLPSHELAGDILNIFSLDESHIALYVLDVSGHGIRAALHAVSMSRLLAPLLDQGSLLKVRDESSPRKYRLTSPAEVARTLNQRFPMDPENLQYFTMLYGILNLKTGEFTYVPCANPGFVRVSPDGEMELLENPGYPIGLEETADFEEFTIQLKKGERLYIYTDGIPEAENPQEEYFSQEQVLRTLEKHEKVELEASLDAIVNTVHEWCGTNKFKDDITLLGLEYRGPNAP